MIINTLKNLSSLITFKEKKNGLKVLLATLLGALIDVVGISSIMPFITLLSNPKLIETNSIASYIYILFSFNSHTQFFLFIGFITLIVMITSLVSRMLIIKMHLNYSMQLEFNLSKRIVERYLENNYEWFLSSHTANLGKSILSEVETIVTGGVMQILLITSQLAVISIMMSILFLMDPFLFASLVIMLVISYVAIYILISPKVSKLGSMRTIANEGRFKSITEMFGAIKQIKVSNAESIYISSYEIPARNYAFIRSSFSMMAHIPRFAIEAAAFGGAILLLITLISREENLSFIMPTITLCAIVGYKLIPALQLVYSGFTQLKFVSPTLDGLIKQINTLSEKPTSSLYIDNKELSGTLTLCNVFFSYDGSKTIALNNISFSIPKGKKIGIIGLTGSGKSTLIDILLGLLRPTKGYVMVGNTKLNQQTLKNWQKKIGYVSQNIYLSDASIAENIAFGVSKHEINYEMVRRASKLACLHDFVVDNLKNGYETVVGERGVRLSGGERQRIGIARALYTCPEILILDEATSSLDNITEANIMESLGSLDKGLTVITVAHRLSTVRNCDKLYLMDKGRIIEEGSYLEMNRHGNLLKKMLEVSA